MAIGTITATKGRAGGERLLLAEAAIEAGLHPAELYAKGARGEVELIRDGGRWYVERWQVEALLSRREAEANRG